MNSNYEYFLRKLSWPIFVLIILFYGFMYAPFGLDNNDSGFILGLAHQVFLGESFYDEIIYVRPPVSPILHSFVFYEPFSIAPMLFDRLFVIFQIATYSFLSAILAKNYFNWTSEFAGVISSLAFVFSCHSFPLMAWHTIDGVFFSIVAIYFLVLGVSKCNCFLFLAACLSILAAAAKQPFYLSPLIILGLSLILEGKIRVFFINLVSIFCASALFMVALGEFGAKDLFFDAISSQTSLHDLLRAGVYSYVKDIVNLRSIFGALPLLAVLVFIFIKNKQTTISSYFLILSIFLFLITIGQFYFSLTAWGQPLPVFDSIFVTTFLCSAAMIWRTRKDSWMVMFAMHVIAWSASISWGYQTAILYAAPSVITVAFFVENSIKSNNLIKAACIAILPISVAIFFMANQYTYSLEGPVQRASITADMSKISPVLKYIKSTPEQHKLYTQLMSIMKDLGDSQYVVLPNIPLAHALQGKPNPLGIDWPLNAEVGKHKQKLKDRLSNRVDFAIIHKKASPKPETEGMFGSEITAYVANNWHLVKLTENFAVFENTKPRTKN